MRVENTTAAIHGGFTQQMRGEQISHREDRKRESSSKRRWKDGMEEWLMIHKNTGWRSPVVAG